MRWPNARPGSSPSPRTSPRPPPVLLPNDEERSLLSLRQKSPRSSLSSQRGFGGSEPSQDKLHAIAMAGAQELVELLKKLRPESPAPEKDAPAEEDLAATDAAAPSAPLGVARLPTSTRLENTVNWAHDTVRSAAPSCGGAVMWPIGAAAPPPTSQAPAPRRRDAHLPGRETATALRPAIKRPRARTLSGPAPDGQPAVAGEPPAAVAPEPTGLGGEAASLSARSLSSCSERAPWADTTCRSRPSAAPQQSPQQPPPPTSRPAVTPLDPEARAEPPPGSTFSLGGLDLHDARAVADFVRRAMRIPPPSSGPPDGAGPQPPLLRAAHPAPTAPRHEQGADRAPPADPPLQPAAPHGSGPHGEGIGRRAALSPRRRQTCAPADERTVACLVAELAAARVALAAQRRPQPGLRGTG
eukprot:TRINITY_DN11284_c0_g1_i1.p1 TRINITY_DN11284_c0_g1~~TRINITY_DN11284_c0_g1_i1.p1  ORF type:complete len:440 (+),score=87.02 TRINITY_DN11284_c0_g1_i1:83-1321(+)